MVLDKEYILEFLKTNSEKLKSEFHIQKIGLIGSFARDEQIDTSDIDFIIEFEPGTENLYELKQNLRNFLKIAFDRDIDLCRDKYLKPFIKSHLRNEAIYVR